jgi:signal transduction histidine kinase
MKDNATILETINQSAMKLLAQESFTKLCKIIVEDAKKLVGGDHGSLFLFSNNKLDRIYTTLTELKKTKTKKQSFPALIAKSRRIVILKDREIGKIYPELKPFNVKSVVMLPLVYKAEPVGVLAIDSYQEDFFTQLHIHILKLYVSLASLAVIRIKLNNETKHALEIRDRFISLASHELRTPLTSINGYIQLLYNKMANKDTIESRWMEELYNESMRLTNLVKELLDINRIKQGQFPFSLSEVDMKNVIEKVVKQYRFHNPDREIVFEDKITDKQSRVIGDFDKLREMISALLSNAVKYSNSQSKIVISLEPTSRTLRIKMKDFGKGIPQDELSSIFEKEGMGMGLLLAQHVVTYHRGKIAIKSKDQKGTTVDVELPRIKME